MYVARLCVTVHDIVCHVDTRSPRSRPIRIRTRVACKMIIRTPYGTNFATATTYRVCVFSSTCAIIRTHCHAYSHRLSRVLVPLITLIRTPLQRTCPACLNARYGLPSSGVSASCCSEYYKSEPLVRVRLRTSPARERHMAALCDSRFACGAKPSHAVHDTCHPPHLRRKRAFHTQHAS